jgi:hypothetical protein
MFHAMFHVDTTHIRVANKLLIKGAHVPFTGFRNAGSVSNTLATRCLVSGCQEVLGASLVLQVLESERLSSHQTVKIGVAYKQFV